MNNFVRILNSTRTTIDCELSHENKPGDYTLYGKFHYDRVTGDISIVWDFHCPLSLVVRLKESVKFLSLCGRL